MSTKICSGLSSWTKGADSFATSSTCSTQSRQWLKTFSINKGDGSKNVTFNMNWHFFQLLHLFQFAENSYCRPISLELISLRPHSSLERERKVCHCLFKSSIKRETKIIFTSYSCSNDKEMYKKAWCIHVQTSCFALKLLLFWTFSLLSWSSLLKLPADISRTESFCTCVLAPK